MRKKIIKNFEGLDYVTVVVQVKKSPQFGDEIILADPRDIERAVALELIERRVPIKGQELRVIKSAIGLSYDAIAERMGVSKQTLIGWAKNKGKRLTPPFEVSFRVLAAEELGIMLIAKLDQLRSDDKAPKIKIDAA